MLAQVMGEVGIGVKRGAKEPAVGTTEFLVQLSEQAEGKNRFVLRLGGEFCLFKISVPEESCSETIALLAHAIQCGAKAQPSFIRLAASK